MTQSKKSLKKSASSPSVPNRIEMDEGVFGTRLIERGELPINPNHLLELFPNLKKLQLLQEDETQEDWV